MRNEFIETANVNKFGAICAELEDPASLVGPSLAMATGPAGRGKSEAAKRYATQTEAVYIPPFNKVTHAMLLREIAFELAKVRPVRSEACLEIIGDEMRKERRLVIIDEADLLPMPILEMLRNLNERCSFPIMLLGEDELKGKIESRRRLSSRIRRRLEFGPVTQQDIAYFFKRALDLKITPDLASPIHQRSRGDWRPVLTAAIGIERAMKASNLTEITLELVKDVIRDIQ
jgi:DNA transposition AAA+ family ATPase